MAVRADVRNAAGFIRDPGAAVTAALLPFSASVKYDGKVRGLPASSELLARRVLDNAAILAHALPACSWHDSPCLASQ